LCKNGKVKEKNAIEYVNSDERLKGYFILILWLVILANVTNHNVTYYPLKKKDCHKKWAFAKNLIIFFLT